MSNRERLQRVMRLYATRAIRRRQEVDVGKLALRLSSRYPQSGLPIHQICQQIEAMLADATAQSDEIDPTPLNPDVAGMGTRMGSSQLREGHIPASTLGPSR
jgi:hypothetical protein